MSCSLLNANLIIQAVNIISHLALHRRVTGHVWRLFIFHTQGRNCEHNYDDCLLNPCPGAFSCVDGINKVSCLPPVTDAVPLATVVKNTTLGSTPRVPMPTLSPAPTAEQFAGMQHTSTVMFICYLTAIITAYFSDYCFTCHKLTQYKTLLMNKPEVTNLFCLWLLINMMFIYIQYMLPLDTFQMRYDKCCQQFN